jgi:hypothetical protein
LAGRRASGPSPLKASNEVFFLLRSAFWIVAVSFLLNGGTLPNAANERIPASARESAAKVVTAVQSLHNACDRHRGTCDAVGGALDFAKIEAEAAGKALIHAANQPKGE